MNLSANNMSFNNENNNKLSNYVAIDRLYEIARQLAVFELNYRHFNTNCEKISLLETNAINDYQMILETINTNNNSNNNYCEVVSVPTSAHVAQIVGKQGSKIKLLRAKSQTYIQTPVSGEEPVFIITGRREDVLKVKAEILSAAEHFTAVSDERKLKLQQTSATPGSVSLNLIIPSFLIGLIVGRNGNTIRNIQKTTDTYIETPKMDELTAFKISGKAANVESAKNAIIAHIKAKTNRNFTAIERSEGNIQLDFDVVINESKGKTKCAYV